MLGSIATHRVRNAERQVRADVTQVIAPPFLRIQLEKNALPTLTGQLICTRVCPKWDAHLPSIFKDHVNLCSDIFG